MSNVTVSLSDRTGDAFAPIVYDGYVYVSLRYGVCKCVNDGVFASGDWSLLDDSNAPSSTDFVSVKLSAKREFVKGSVIHFIGYYLDGSDYVFTYNTFDMSTDTWDVTDDVITTAEFASNGGGVFIYGSTVYVVCDGPEAGIMGTGYGRVYVYKRVSANNWTEYEFDSSEQINQLLYWVASGGSSLWVCAKLDSGHYIVEFDCTDDSFNTWQAVNSIIGPVFYSTGTSYRVGTDTYYILANRNGSHCVILQKMKLPDGGTYSQEYKHNPSSGYLLSTNGMGRSLWDQVDDRVLYPTKRETSPYPVELYEYDEAGNSGSWENFSPAGSGDSFNEWSSSWDTSGTNDSDFIFMYADYESTTTFKFNWFLFEPDSTETEMSFALVSPDSNFAATIVEDGTQDMSFALVSPQSQLDFVVSISTPVALSFALDSPLSELDLSTWDGLRSFAPVDLRYSVDAVLITADANRFICTVHGVGGDFVVPMTFVSISISANLETETTQISINIPAEYAPLVAAEKDQLLSVYQQLDYAGSTFNDLLGSATITSVSAGVKLGSIRASKTDQPAGTFAQGVEIDQSKIIFETLGQLRIPLRKDIRAGSSIVMNGTAKEITMVTTYITTTSALMEIIYR